MRLAGPKQIGTLMAAAMLSAAAFASAALGADPVLGADFAGDPAPAKNGVLVILTDVPESGPFAPMLSAAVKALKPKSVLRFERGEVGKLSGRLKELKPSDVVVVSLPETLDLAFHLETLLMSLDLDADPFPDFRLGYVTAALPAEGDAFLKAAARASSLKNKFPATATEAGPSIKSRLDIEKPSITLPGLKIQRILHSGMEFLHVNKALFEGRGFLRLTGEGSPFGVNDGLNSQFFRETRVRLFPAVVIAGGDMLATADYYYPEGSGGRNRRIDAGESFLLALISREPSGLILSFGRGSEEAAKAEFERMTWFGQGGGDAVRATWIEALLSRAGGALKEEVDAELKKKPADHSGWFALLSRAYFGDPSSHQLLKPLGRPVAQARASATEKGLEIECVLAGAELLDSATWSAGGADQDMVHFTVALEAGQALPGARVADVEVSAGDRFPRVSFSRVAFERWADQVICHVFLLLDSMGGGRAFKSGEAMKIRVLIS